jgi:hypothetical protein
MAVYKAGSPTLSPRQQRTRQLTISLLVIGEIFALFVVLFAFYKRDTASVAPVEGSAVNAGFYDPNPMIKSNDFTFKAPNNWSLDPTESSSGLYVYKAHNGPLITQVLYIGVNSPIKEERVTYLMPVTADGDKMTLSNMSNHCGKLTTKDGMISYGGATFKCWAQNGQAFVGVSEVGASSGVTLKSESGVSKKYYFRLVDSRFSPSFNDITNILKSFRAK